MKFKEYLTEEQLIEITIAHAATFAAELHQGQHRKGSGAPYIVHPRGVFKIIRALGIKSRDLLAAAYLHDTTEDTSATYNKIKKEFGKAVADLVKEVSSDKKLIGKIGKDEYLTSKMLKMSNFALILKLADRLQNLSDIMVVSKGFAEKMWNQTRYIITALRNERNLNKYQKKLVRMIGKQLQVYKAYEI